MKYIYELHNKNMRSFISIEIDDFLLDNICDLQSKIKKLNVNIKFVEIANLHFTVNFLGDINDSQLDEISNSLRFLSYEREFKINISGTGYFGNEHHIRNVWLGVKVGKGELLALMKKINEAVKIGERINVPHLTICRVKSNENNENLLDFINRNTNMNIGEMFVKNVKIKKSVLTATGPVYSDLYSFMMGSGEQ